MRRFLLTLLISLLLPLSAIAEDTAAESESALLQKAAAGDDMAKFNLGSFYCKNEEPKAYGAKTLKWWEEAAKSDDPTRSAPAEEALGNFYLSLYPPETDNVDTVTAYTYDPAKENAPVQYCTGSQHNAANDEKAVKHFKRCMEFPDNYAPTGCQLGMGHLYFSEQKYDEAYFWYAALIADEITTSKSDSSSSYTPIDYDGPLLGAMAKLPAEWQQSVASYTHLAEAAAKHLTPEQIAEGDKKARAWTTEQYKKQEGEGLPPVPEEKK